MTRTLIIGIPAYFTSKPLGCALYIYTLYFSTSRITVQLSAKVMATTTRVVVVGRPWPAAVIASNAISGIIGIDYGHTTSTLLIAPHADKLSRYEYGHTTSRISRGTVAAEQANDSRYDMTEFRTKDQRPRHQGPKTGTTDNEVLEVD